MEFVLALLSAISAIPKIAGYVEQFASWVTLWWVQRQNRETQALIADAAALGARAETDEDRFKCTDLWHNVIGRPRMSK